jgi:hypothetical protein
MATPSLANRLEAATPVVLEGDFIHPWLGDRQAYGEQPNPGRVRAVFVHEPDEKQLLANFGAREPNRRAAGEAGPRIVALREWLADEARRRGQPVVQAGPWATLFERVLAVIEQ